mmetsp:Transcript_113573/g.212792  ORF Transcript_113573/g.212792 Transcript_113573/m.212792 type:complete len:287 (+) Transcript_113573:26-886(+)
MAYTFIVLFVFLFLITSGHRKEKDSVQVLGSGSMVKGAQKNVGKVVAKMNTTNKSATSGPNLERLNADQLRVEVEKLQREIAKRMNAGQLRVEVKRLQKEIEYLDKEDVQRLFKEFDTDGDGFITPEEFEKHLLDRKAAVRIQSMARGRFARRGVKAAAVTSAEAKAAQSTPPRPQQSDSMKFSRGMKVTISGLKGATELNGKSGTIQRFDAAAGRYVVKVHESGELKKVQPDNLTAANKMIITRPDIESMTNQELKRLLKEHNLWKHQLERDELLKDARPLAANV